MASLPLFQLVLLVCIAFIGVGLMSPSLALFQNLNQVPPPIISVYTADPPMLTVGGLFVDQTNNNLYMGDLGHRRLIKTSLNHTQLLDFPLMNGNGYSPDSIAVDSAGNIYVADCSPSSRGVGKYSSNGSLLLMFPYFQGRPVVSRATAIDPQGNTYYADQFSHEILKFDPEGNLLLSTLNAPIVYPWGITVGADLNVYACDLIGQKIWKFSPTLELTGSIPLNHDTCSHVAVDQYGNIYTLSGQLNSVVVYSGNGTLSAFWNVSKSTQAMTLDKDRNVYIADYYNSSVSAYASVFSAVSSSELGSAQTNNNEKTGLKRRRSFSFKISPFH